MGQRSQIYVRYNGKLLFANYYQWNYAERMISRARWGMEHIKYYVDNGYDFAFNDSHYIEKMRRMFDVNFDMKDIVMSCDIVKEWIEQYADDDPFSFNDVVFNGQDNNDGQLYIDIKGKKMYYGFRDWTRHEDQTTSDVIMSASEYMDWDAEEWENSQYIPDEMKEACRENIKEIEQMAELMTLEDLDDFTHGNYIHKECLPF